jgi:hypothetical protein
MRPRPTLVSAIVTMVVASLMSGVAQRAPDGTAGISGTVTTTGVAPAPLARVLVTISGDSLKPSRTTISDDRGRYAFPDLSAGRFTIVAARSPYVKTAFGAKRPGRPGTPIVLAAGQRITDVTIPLTRGAAITGLVRAPGGEPATGIQIVATRLDDPGDPAVAPVVTDDRGLYRLFGLAPGKYIVRGSVAERGNTGFSQLSDAEMDDVLASLQRKSRLGATSGSSTPGASPAATTSRTESSIRSATYDYAPVYYPGTSDPDQAATVTLAEGDERGAVDFDLQLVRTLTVEGRVSIAGEKLPAGIQVTLTRADLRGRPNVALDRPGTARLDDSGRFRFANVLPGKYRVLARVMTTTRAAQAPAVNAATTQSQAAVVRMTDVFWALADVFLGDDDLTGVALTLQPGLKVTGRLVFDASTRPRPEAVPLRLTELGGGSTLTRSGNGRADGTFEIIGLLPGSFAIASPLADANWWLRSVMINGRDVLDSALDLGATGDVNGLVATFTDRHTEISGLLQSVAPVAASDYFVVVFSTDQAFWRPPSRRVRFTRPSLDGRYVLRDLPAGDYLIAAVTDMEPSDLTEVSFLERLIPTAVRVQLDNGQQKAQDISVVR